MRGWQMAAATSGGTALQWLPCAPNKPQVTPQAPASGPHYFPSNALYIVDMRFQKGDRPQNVACYPRLTLWRRGPSTPAWLALQVLLLSTGREPLILSKYQSHLFTSHARPSLFSQLTLRRPHQQRHQHDHHHRRLSPASTTASTCCSVRGSSTLLCASSIQRRLTELAPHPLDAILLLLLLRGRDSQRPTGTPPA